MKKLSETSSSLGRNCTLSWWVTLTVSLSTETVCEEIFLDMLLQLLESSDSRCVFSAVG